MLTRVWLGVVAAAALAGGAAAREFRNHAEISASILLGQPMLAYEHSMGGKLSACLGAGYRWLTTDEILFMMSGPLYESLSVDCVVVYPGLKYFPLGNLRGLVLHYEAAARDYIYRHSKVENYYDEHTGKGHMWTFVPALLGGWRWVPGGRVTITATGGAEYNFGTVPGSPLKAHGVTPRIDLNLGYLF